MERALHRYRADLKQHLIEDTEAKHRSVRAAARTTVTMIQKWLEG